MLTLEVNYMYHGNIKQEILNVTLDNFDQRLKVTPNLVDVTQCVCEIFYFLHTVAIVRLQF